MSRPVLPEAFFEPHPGGHRFWIYHSPAGPASRAVLYVPPLCEEMNRSRRMAALQARELSRAGIAVLLPDLHGCGDSSGDLSSACFTTWIADLFHAAQWLRRRHAAAPLSLWGLRAGCLLALAASAHLAPIDSFVFWQPTLDGQAVVQNQLRLKLAAGLQGLQEGKTTKFLRHQMQADGALDIAGYRFPDQLARDLESARLEDVPSGSRLDWFEVSTREPPELLPASRKLIDALVQRGVSVQAKAVIGPPFWQTAELEDAPALVQCTARAMTTCPAA